MNKSALQESYRDPLEKSGLIQGYIRTDHQTGLPSFDTFFGKPNVSYTDTTHLGRMLLRQIGITDE